ncbi:MAG: hypothetical protein ACK583_17830 [Cyanobacteriota bacterium]
MRHLRLSHWRKMPWVLQLWRNTDSPTLLQWVKGWFLSVVPKKLDCQ